MKMQRHTNGESSQHWYRSSTRTLRVLVKKVSKGNLKRIRPHKRQDSWHASKQKTFEKANETVNDPLEPVEEK